MNFMRRYTNKQNLGASFYSWNPWNGCYKKSEACQNCFIQHLGHFENIFWIFPGRLAKLPSGTLIHLSLYSDFFLEDADKFRQRAWNTIKKYPNLIFLIITKRPERIKECLPEDWGDGWENVIFAVTMENQIRVNERMPYLLDVPCKHKWVACTPLLEAVDLSEHLKTKQIEHVEVAGEKVRGTQVARPLQIDWVKKLKDQCEEYKVRLSFLTAGHNCVLEDGTSVKDDSTCYHSEMADNLEMSYYEPLAFNLPDGTFTY